MRNLHLIIYIYTAMAVLGLTTTTPATAQTATKATAIVDSKKACGIDITDVTMKREAGLMTIKMNFATGKFNLSGNRAAIFTPIIINGTDSLALQPIGLYSRTRWYQYLRSGEKPLGGERETTIRWSERPEQIDYSQVVPYADWMNGSQLYLRRSDYGCCRTLISEQAKPLTSYRILQFVPTFRYVRPVAEKEKTRELVGKAYIDFPVNRTEIDPYYRKNPTELAKIVATIDSVRNDKDVTVRRITIKGYASPEGSYDNNIRLARGRTETLKQYVQELYHFPYNFIATDYEPEDWAGLRAFVETSNLEHRIEILTIIDCELEPDPKEWRLKSTYPEEYRFLLQTVYPGLRHSDYTIEYTIRQFTDLNEIRSMLATAPQKLSLNEMFLLAQSLEPGSEEYNRVFETAVRMYPNDEVANLNAANAAMQRGDYVTAEKYLSKAGNGTEATYAKGVLAAQQSNYATAVQYFSQVESNMPEAAKALQTIREIIQITGE